MLYLIVKQFLYYNFKNLRLNDEYHAKNEIQSKQHKIRNLENLCNDNLDFVRTKTKETVLYSFRQCNKNPQQNLSKEELAALTIFRKNKDILMQKSEKANSVAIVDKETSLRESKILKVSK